MIENTDIRNEDCLLSNIQKESVDLIITDPPYFVLPNGKKSFKKQYDFSWDNFCNLNEFKVFTKTWFDKYYETLKQNSFMFIFWSQKYIAEGFEIFNPNRLLIYHYSNLVQGGGGNFCYDYEPIFCIKKGSPKLVPGKHSCIFKYTKPQSNFKSDKLIHPTQKPKELYKKLIEISGLKEHSIILDPFAGSGTLNRAAKEMSILFNTILIEKDKKYYNTILETT